MLGVAELELEAPDEDELVALSPDLPSLDLLPLLEEESDDPLLDEESLDFDSPLELEDSDDFLPRPSDRLSLR